MNFAAYIEKQKSLIRSRHEGETYLVAKGKEIKVADSEKLLYELENLKGLNKRERRELVRGQFSRRRAKA